MVRGPLTQCPACMTRPTKLARKGRICEASTDRLVEITDHGGIETWLCHRCCCGHDALEFVSFALYADRFCNLTKPQKRGLEGWFSVLPDRVFRS